MYLIPLPRHSWTLSQWLKIVPPLAVYREICPVGWKLCAQYVVMTFNAHMGNDERKLEALAVASAIAIAGLFWFAIGIFVGWATWGG
jgi:hypothetical protein